MNSDIQVLRELARQYADVAACDVQEERRQLWARHNSLKPTRVLVLATFGMWNVWCREVFSDAQMKCRDAFYREHERSLRLQLFQHAVGDDFILEPWITQRATLRGGWGRVWGVEQKHIGPGVEGGAWRFDPPLRDWSDVRRLIPPQHSIDEDATAENVRKLQDAVGDILEVNVDRGPLCQGFLADISTDLAQLRGLEQVMVDMCEAPERLEGLLAFMQGGILANQAQAEASGDWSLTDQGNQAMTYAEELPRPKANCLGQQRRGLWGFCAAQEFTGVSPAMHEQFLLRYQLPIMRNFALVHYGCCEDLTHKIDMLRQVPNLRSIAVTPRADVRRCAEQIGADYVLAWRPNPTDMVCYGFDERRIRTILRAGLEACRGCRVHVHLKDVETVEGDPTRLAKWVRLVREVAEEVG